MLGLSADLSYWELWLYGFAVYCAVGLVWYWFRFQLLEARAQGGDPEDVSRFNRVLKGFPNVVFAKMLGKRPLEERSDG